MTITIETNSTEQMEQIKKVAKEIYDYVDIDKEHIPMSINIIENIVYIYITDGFAKYTIDYLFSLFNISMTRSPSSKVHMIALSKNFREGAEEMLMSNVVL